MAIPKKIRTEIERLPYPRIPYDERKTVKITLAQRQEIIKQFSNGITINTLAKTYHVYNSTIKLIVDPEWRVKRNKEKSDYQKERMKNTSFIKHMKYLKREWIKNRLKEDAGFRKYIDNQKQLWVENQLVDDYYVFENRRNLRTKLPIAYFFDRVEKELEAKKDLVCPRCNSSNLKDHGWRHQKIGDVQCYNCNECGKYFTRMIMST